jgi:hypothetical protein
MYDDSTSTIYSIGLIMVLYLRTRFNFVENVNKYNK